MCPNWCRQSLPHWGFFLCISGKFHDIKISYPANKTIVCSSFVRFQTTVDSSAALSVNYFENGSIFERREDRMQRVRWVGSLSYSRVRIHLQQLPQNLLGKWRGRFLNFPTLDDAKKWPPFNLFANT